VTWVAARHPKGGTEHDLRTLLDTHLERTATLRRERTLPRPGVARGQTVGLLDISKPRGDVFLDRLEERLLVEAGAHR
jgi:hypothetical protein